MPSFAPRHNALGDPAAPTAAVVLAGGRATRMGGGDKALRDLAGRTLLDHVLARIAPQVDRIALNANGDPARFAAWGLPVLADPVPDFPGPLAGVLAGLLWARALGSGDLLVVPTDTPFLPADLVARLRAGRGAEPVACAASLGRLHPVVGLWRVDVAESLAGSLAGGERKVERWLRAQGLAEVDFRGSDGADPFANVNTPEDLACAARRLAGA